MSNAVQKGTGLPTRALDDAISDLYENKDKWAQTSIPERLAILAHIKENLLKVAEGWVDTATRKKFIPAGSPLVGEEWLSGPYAMMAGCNAFIQTLSEMKHKQHIAHLPVRELDNGQIAATVFPHSIWDRLLLSGVKADVWMQPGVTRQNLASNTASSYDIPAKDREGKVSLVLGAGNIASIAPLDCFHKLFVEHQVVLLKMNPVNDYLAEYLSAAMRPLIDMGALRIVKGGTDVGKYLCNHPDISDIHITGAEASHDAIVWGVGEEGLKNKANGTPQNTRRITSELGAVCPTIVVPGPWTDADLTFQAEQIATQKLHNSGFNCIACQMLVVPGDWDKTDTLISKIKKVMALAPPRPLYYPGTNDRMDEFAGNGNTVEHYDRNGSPSCIVVPFNEGDNDYFENNEVFAPAFNVNRLAGLDPETYLLGAIEYANKNLHGTLGANILIHPWTIRKIGKKRFEQLIGELKYGCIAINAWTGLGFTLFQTPWGAFPGHTLDDVQSGIGFVHNSFMFDKPERTVVTAPFRPFPRNLLSGGFTLLPRPPWFVTNRKADKVGKLLTKFQYKPGFMKLPRIFLNALFG